MTDITITEAIAEIKTIGKRIEKKREFITTYLSRQEGVKDPLEKQGGSFENIKQEIQAIMDLENRVVALRRGIQKANDATTVTIGERSRSISDWLVWRREAAPMHQQFLNGIRHTLNQVRTDAARKNVAVVSATIENGAKPTDFIVNIDEQRLSAEIEDFETTLGKLDGILSLKNATVFIK